MINARDPILEPYPPAEFLRYVELFNAGAFFEAHEVLEDLWVITPGEEREFYKGLIMLAVGLLHARRGNHQGAKGVLSGALGHLKKFPAQFGGLVITDGIAAAEAVLTGTKVPTSGLRIGLIHSGGGG